MGLRTWERRAAGGLGRYMCMVAIGALLWAGGATATQLQYDTLRSNNVVADDDDGLLLGNNDYSGVFIKDDATVGVGTSSPSALLTVNEPDESGTQTDFTRALDKAGLLIETEYTANSYTPGLFWYTSNNNTTKPKAGIYLRLTSSGTHMYFGTTNSYSTGVNNDAIVIEPTGNVGIGSVSAENKLDVGGAMVIGASYAGTETAPANGLLVQGNVGLGKNTAAYKLDVSGAIKCDTVRIGSTTMRASGDGDDLWLNGHLGVLESLFGGISVIGTALVSENICAEGGVTADSATFGKIVVSDWSIEAPDFVFTASYRLPKLKDVETYVQKHKHLEGVPSASEMKQNGVDLTKMNMALLEKVEQLTLYAIAQQKEIDALKAKMK